MVPQLLTVTDSIAATGDLVLVPGRKNLLY